MRIIRNIGCFIGLVPTLLVIVLVVGYVKNVIKLMECDFEPSYKAEILHTVGIATGLGGIFGYCDFGK